MRLKLKKKNEEMHVLQCSFLVKTSLILENTGKINVTRHITIKTKSPRVSV